MSERLARKLRIKAFGSMLRKRIAWFDKYVADAVFSYWMAHSSLYCSRTSMSIESSTCITPVTCAMWLCVSKGGELDRLAHHPALRGRL